jgi:hypothetical protein
MLGLKREGNEPKLCTNYMFMQQPLIDAHQTLLRTEITGEPCENTDSKSGV